MSQMTGFVVIFMTLVLVTAGAAPCKVEENGECVAEQSAVSLLQGKVDIVKKDGATVDDEDGLDDDGARTLLTQRDTGRRRRKGGVKKVVRKVRRAVRRAARVVRVGFSTAWRGVVKQVGGTYMKVISHCNSPSSCKRKLLSFGGLKGAWQKKANLPGILKATRLLPRLIKPAVQSATSKIPNFGKVKKLVKTGAATARDLRGRSKRELQNIVREAGKVTKSVSKGFKGWASGYKKKRINWPCLRARNKAGWWYMKPTDCGAFTELQRAMNSWSTGALNKAANKFKQCVRLKGMLNFPTPFFQLKFTDMCVPTWIKHPIEYLLGTIQFAGKTGSTIARAIDNVVKKVKNIGLNKMKINLIGKAISKRRDFPEMDHHEIAKQVALEEEQERLTGSCGKKTWSLSMGLAFSAQVAMKPQISVGVGCEIAIVVGCLKNRPMTPQPVFMFMLHAAWSPEAETGAGAVLAMAWDERWPFANDAALVDIGGTFDVAIAADLTGLPTPLGPVPCGEIGIDTQFPYPPVQRPYGFGLGIPIECEKSASGTFLTQADSSIESSEETFEDPLLAELHERTNVLAQRDLEKHVDSVFSHTNIHEHFLHTALAIDKHGKERLLADVTARASNGGPFVENEVGSSMGITLCLNPKGGCGPGSWSRR